MQLGSHGDAAVEPEFAYAYINNTFVYFVSFVVNSFSLCSPCLCGKQFK